jgi:cobalt-zinc-cadmium efflux system protein
MAHAHEHTTQKSYGKAFALGIGLNLIFIVVEVIYG